MSGFNISDVDPSIATRLLAGYQLSYATAYQAVMLVVAGICLIGSAVLWFALRPQDEPAQTAQEIG